MKQLFKGILFSAFLLQLSACGGGGGGEDKAAEPISPPPPVIEPPKNNVPTLSFSTSLELNELETSAVEITVSDADNDPISLSITSSHPNLVVISETDGVVSLTAQAVDEDTIITIEIVASDGTDEVSGTLNVLIKNIPEVELELSAANLTINEQESGSITFESKNGTVTVVSDNPAIASVERIDNTLNVTGAEVLEDKNVNITITINNAETGKSLTKILTVSVLDVPVSEGVMEITMPTNSEGVVAIETYKENVIPVNLSSTTNESLTWSIESLESNDVNYADAVIDMIESFHPKDGSFVITTRSMPIGMQHFDFLLSLQVTNGTKSSIKTFVLRLADPINSKPLISINNSISAFGVLPINTPTKFQITFTDDAPEKIEIDLLNTRVWFGDAEIFSYTIDDINNTITVDPGDAQIGEEFGIFLAYTDANINSSDYGAFRFMVSHVMGDYEKENLDYLQIVHNKLSALKEYQYLTDFYTQVLENNNLLNHSEVTYFNQAAKVTDSSSYSIAVSSIYTFEARTVLGTDETWGEETAESYKELIDSQIQSAETFFNRNAQVLVNELGLRSNNLLPTFEFEEILNLYDTENNLYSRFAGNVKYGEYVDGKFVFSDEYSFLNAIIEKSVADTATVFEHK
ncbi:hypothetical protein I6F53_11235 [Pseudoalteromonas sp. SWN29]|uniref:hypothetical protein n=1 Tax=Pseudoalteromonas sp. SWN29 TaxID=2792064 RepID=UPI0018CF5D27|nr:hypothetical protein [Pseudoalteromonas sp. SWN29]MBH0027557.1 hypothetical protein [Pseudoalteromonas sp. SWN29]